MRKTRLVLIPGVKSLDTIGCLLLFLACPTIAFKGQENREVDTICKAQNLKEFWVDSPWPGDTENIGWVRGFGGGIRTGNLQEKNTCNGLSTRSAVRSRRSNSGRVQVRREASRDDGMETRKNRLENDMRRDTLSEVSRRADYRAVRDSRRVMDRTILDEGRRMESRRVSENREDSRAWSMDQMSIRSQREVREVGFRRDSRDHRDARMGSTEQRIVTTREQVEGRGNPTTSRNAERQIRSNLEAREPEFRRTNREMTNIAAERGTVRKREVIDGRRSSRGFDHSQVNGLNRRASTDSRAASLERVDSRYMGDQGRVDVGQNVNSRRVHGTIDTRAAIRSVERDIRSNEDVREAADRRDSQSRANQRMGGERMMRARDGLRTDFAYTLRSVDRRDRTERSFRTESNRLGLSHQRTQSRGADEGRSVERPSADSWRESSSKRDSIRNERQGIRAERKVRETDSRVPNRMETNIAEHRQEVVGHSGDSVRLVERETRYNRQVTQPGRHQMRSGRETPKTEYRQNKINLRISQSLENIRSVEEPKSYIRRLAVERRDSRWSLERELRLNKHITDRRASQDTRESRNLDLDVASTNNFDATDNRRNSGLSNLARERQRSLSSPGNLIRERGVDSRLTVVAREGSNIRASREIVSQRVTDVERAERRIHESRSLQRLQQSARSVEDVRHFDDRRENEREARREGRNSDRLTRATEKRRNERQVGSQFISSQRIRENSRSSEDVRQSDQQNRLVRKQSRHLDRKERGDFRREVDAERNDNRRQKDIRAQTRLQREVQSTEDVREVDRRTPVTLNQRETSPSDSRRTVETRRNLDTRFQSQALVRVQRLERRMPVARNDRETLQSNTRRRAETRRNLDSRSQTRSLEDVQRLVSGLSVMRNDQGIVQSDSRHRVETRRNLDNRFQSRALEGVQGLELRMPVARNDRETLQSETRRRVETRRNLDSRSQTRSLEDVQRLVNGLSVTRNDWEIVQSDSRHRVETQRNLDNRFQSRALEGVRRLERRMPVAQNDRETLQSDTRRRVETRRNLDSRSQTRSLEDFQRLERQMPVSRNDREIVRSDSRRRVETQRNLDTRSQTRSMEDVQRLVSRSSVTRNDREIVQSDSRRKVETQRNIDSRSQTRSLEDVRRFDSGMPVTRNNQELVRNTDTRRRVETLWNSNRATPNRINRRTTHSNERLFLNSGSSSVIRERETRLMNERLSTERDSRVEKRETDFSRMQRRLESRDFRRHRDSRDTEIRKISKDVSLKVKPIQTEEARRSERQRRVDRDSSRLTDKRHEIYSTEFIRRFDEYAELTSKPRRTFSTHDVYAGKTNLMEQNQKLSNEDGFFESTKNALASWLATDISRTDLNGIAETLMYGGIACFALFSSVNKKVIF